jgi:hypothetical protein
MFLPRNQAYQYYWVGHFVSVWSSFTVIQKARELSSFMEPESSWPFHTSLPFVHSTVFKESKQGAAYYLYGNRVQPSAIPATWRNIPCQLHTRRHPPNTDFVLTAVLKRVTPFLQRDPSIMIYFLNTIVDSITACWKRTFKLYHISHSYKTKGEINCVWF